MVSGFDWCVGGDCLGFEFSFYFCLDECMLLVFIDFMVWDLFV